MPGEAPDRLASIDEVPGMRRAMFRGYPGKGTRTRGLGDRRMSAEPRLVDVRKNVLKQNDIVARALRQSFRETGVFVVSLVSSPGTGKTTFLVGRGGSRD